ncbi:MAG TPA: hypothetical protein VGY54_13225, partial [Polyangiaceae bacterium]|nr:hypothetical protein [Polyangiaceae bacterium]
AQLIITTNVPFDPSHVITLTEVPLGDQLSVSAGSLRFGQVPIGTAVSQSFTISNNANVGSQAQSANLQLTLAGSGSASYSVPQVTSGDLFAGHSALYGLTFNSATATPSPATLTFSTTDPLCTALPAPIVLTGTGTSGLVSVSASTLTFGSPGDANGFVNCGATGQPQTVTISNVGNQSFNVTSVSLGKGAASPFTLAPIGAPVKVPIAGSTTITINPSIIPKVGVDPNNAAAFSDVLTIATDANGDMPHAIALVMQPRGAVISSATQPPATWSFGTIGAGSIGTFLGTTIQNTGNLAATVTLQPTGTLSLPSVFGLQNNPVTAAPGVTALVGQFVPNLANSTWTGQGQLLVTAAAMCGDLPQQWVTPVINLSGSSSSNPIVTLSGSLVFPTSDCGGAPPGGQEVTITNGTNQAYTYTAKFVSGAWYNLVDSGSGSLAANNIAKIVVNPKMVTPGAGVFPGAAPYADDLLISVATTPPTNFTVPISWTLNGAVLTLPKGAGPTTDSQGSFYVADGTSGFSLPMANTGTATAAVSLAIQPTGSFLLQPSPPIAVLPNVPTLPELVTGASAPACPTTNNGTATFVYSGPVCQPFPLASVSVRSCSGTYVGGGGPPVIDAGAETDADAGAAEAASDGGGEEAGSDTGVADDGSDAEEADAGSDGSLVRPTVCTTAPCAPSGSNSVQCTGKADGVCNATEAVIVNRDIAKGNLSGNTLSPDSCYSCLVNARCIDAQTTGKIGDDCDDLIGNVGTGAQASETKQLACLNTLSCLLPASAAASCSNAPSSDMSPSANDGVSNCYCGSNYPTASSCAAASGQSTPPVNGACEALEVDGLGLNQSTSATTVLADYTVKTSGSGMANSILKCAGTNTGIPACPQCFR